VKVWIYKGDIVESRSEREAAALAGATTRSHRRATQNAAPVATLGAPSEAAAATSATEGGQA
jgi:small subunit ribosomal protein S3